MSTTENLENIGFVIMVTVLFVFFKPDIIVLLEAIVQYIGEPDFFENVSKTMNAYVTPMQLSIISFVKFWSPMFVLFIAYLWVRDCIISKKEHELLCQKREEYRKRMDDFIEKYSASELRKYRFHLYNIYDSSFTNIYEKYGFCIGEYYLSFESNRELCECYDILVEKGANISYIKLLYNETLEEARAFNRYLKEQKEKKKNEK